MITRFIKKEKDDYEEELQESWEKKRKARRKNVALEHSQWKSQIIIITKIFTNIFQKVLPKWMSLQIKQNRILLRCLSIYAKYCSGGKQIFYYFFCFMTFI